MLDFLAIGGERSCLLRVTRSNPASRSYLSIPQAGGETTHLAIQSLASYSSLASEFVIVAPPLAHMETLKTCDFATYRRRTWCRAEQLCHLFRNGLDAMWIATSEESVQRLASMRLAESFTASADEAATDDWKHMSEEDWLSESIRVFQGDLTNELDKLSLVMPILGLYAELFAYATGVASAGETDTFLVNVLRLCQASRDEIFPKSFTPEASLSVRSVKASRRRSFKEASPLPDLRGGEVMPVTDSAAVAEDSSFGQRGSIVGEKGVEGGIIMKQVVGKGGELELFGILVEETEAMINEDETLRRRLASNLSMLRQNVVEKRSALTTVAEVATVGKKVAPATTKFMGLLSA